jgi:hypothetical protein
MVRRWPDRHPKNVKVGYSLPSWFITEGGEPASLFIHTVTKAAAVRMARDNLMRFACYVDIYVNLMQIYI